MAVVQVICNSTLTKISSEPTLLRETIFVAITIPPGVIDGMKQIQKLFTSASEPSRVYIGVFDYSDCTLYGLEHLQNNIRRKNMSLEKYYRMSTSRAKIVTQLYFDEMFILFIP